MHCHLEERRAGVLLDQSRRFDLDASSIKGEASLSGTLQLMCRKSKRVKRVTLMDIGLVKPLGARISYYHPWLNSKAEAVREDQEHLSLWAFALLLR